MKYAEVSFHICHIEKSSVSLMKFSLRMTEFLFLFETLICLMYFAKNSIYPIAFREA